MPPTGPTGPTGPPAGAGGRGVARSTGARLTGLAVSLGVLLLVLLLSIAVGTKQIPPGTVVEALLHHDPADGDHVVVAELRLPRTAVGLAVGAALGLAGAIMQALTRNPLAEPGLLGVNAGASAAVVTAIFLFGVTDLVGYVWFAFLGAGAAAAAVHLLGGGGRGGATPVRLALSGMALQAALLGFTQAVVLLDSTALDELRLWNVGSLAGRDLTILAGVTPFLLAGLLLGLGLGGPLNALALGDEVAVALGTDVARVRLLAMLAITLLCGAATAACGPIAFVGLAVPHVARAITGPDQRWVLPYSAVFAAVLLVGADVVGRVVVRPAELQVGIVTALIGAPVFVWLVRRRKVAGL
ncbi:FecCD family ABC transporter permease [Allostreptomyces psammosilenae]|uniref:FecCD family ABC transporter permease n=1 Tax=Allostreptomyces psammosilenae TaxID=1892865 RepID=UPI0015CC151A